MLQWITPAGFLMTATELVSTSTQVIASGTNITYSIVSGKLPSGLTFNNNGTVSGVPDAVINKTQNKFVVRAQNTNTVKDRTFSIDVVGADPPVWITPEGYLPVGSLGEYYALLNQWVDFTVLANPSQAPNNTKIKYFIAERDGKLPNGITLTSDGKLFGFINDQLVPDIDISDTGGYDTEKYDIYSYDHATQYKGPTGVITGSPKIYQFKITATDGTSSTSRLFKILVASTDILQYNSALIPAGIAINTSTNYIQPPQWLINNDLGIIRANNNHFIDVRAYDPIPLVGSLTYSTTTSTNIFQQLPEGLSLNTLTGYLSGFVPYQPAYQLDYSFVIRATKTTPSGSTTATNTFTLSIKGDVESSIRWVSSSTLGSISPGMVSDIAVVAEQINSDYNIKYLFKSGSLPSGISLLQDGSLSGRAAYNSTGTYSFTVIASDVYELSAIERTFTLTVKSNTQTKYTDIYARPFLLKQKRDEYYQFTTDKFVFDPALIYRYQDPNFGVQHDIKLILEFGIEQINLEDYYYALQNNFYRRTLTFGDLKIAVAKNTSGKVEYEVVYVDIIDNLVNNQGQSIDPVIYFSDNIYYPASVDNMRLRLSQLVLQDGEYIEINPDHTPKFMQTAQAGEYKAPEYMRIVPICYALPGQGSKIISRIKLSNFDFKLIHFEIDRLIVQNSLDNSTAKYLIFERQSLGDVIESDNYLYGASINEILYDENGTPLIRE